MDLGLPIMNDGSRLQSTKGARMTAESKKLKTVESYRKMCLAQQTKLHRLLTKVDQYDQAIQLFFRQHAMLHSAKMARTTLWSFEDTVLNDMTEEQIRRVPLNCDHSIAWLMWHMARCEDITMNLLVAGTLQILLRDNWLQQLKISARDIGNAMDLQCVVDLSNTIDIEALRSYRTAVGRWTREIVKQLHPEELKRKADPSRLQQVLDEGAVLPEKMGIIDYWGQTHHSRIDADASHAA